MVRFHWLLAGLSSLALLASSTKAQDEFFPEKSSLEDVFFEKPESDEFFSEEYLSERATRIIQVSAEGGAKPAEQPDAPPPPPADTPAGEPVQPDRFLDRNDTEPNWVNSPATNQYCEPSGSKTVLYGYVDVLFLNRENSVLSSQPVVLDDITQATLLSTGDLSFNGATGPRILLGIGCDDCSAVEFSYFGVYSFSAAAVVTNGNSLDIPPVLVVPATDFNNATEMRVTYDSRMNNVEINGAHFLSGSRPCGGVELLAGFRYINLDETFNINSRDSDDTISDYRIRTKNDLYGGQLGLRCTERWDRLGFEMTGKAGIYANDARTTQFVGDNGNITVLRSTRASKTLTAYSVDANATLSYWLTDNIAIRGGYTVIWIDGVALAPGQLDFTFNALSGTGIDSSSGGLLLHGANVGMEFRW